MVKVRVKVEGKECDIIVGEKPEGITWDRVHEMKKK